MEVACLSMFATLLSSLWSSSANDSISNILKKKETDAELQFVDQYDLLEVTAGNRRFRRHSEHWVYAFSYAEEHRGSGLPFLSPQYHNIEPGRTYSPDAEN